MIILHYHQWYFETDIKFVIIVSSIRKVVEDSHLGTGRKALVINKGFKVKRSFRIPNIGLKLA